MSLYCRSIKIIAAACALITGSGNIAAVLADEPQVKIETIASDLTAPCGLAIQPGSEDVFVSDTGGGQVVKYPRLKPSEPVVVITGFPHEPRTGDKHLTAHRGPLGLAFLGDSTLAVGATLKNGQPTLRVFSLPTPSADAKTAALDFNDPKQNPAPAKSAEKSPSAERSATDGTYYAAVVSLFVPPAVFVTNPGSNRGWLFKAEIKNRSSLEELQPLVATKSTPIGIAINPRGLVVVSLQTADPSSASAIAFYSGKDGRLLANMPTTLEEIVGLAYSPESGRLYAANFAADDPSKAGIYRLDAAMVDGRSGIKAVKIAPLEHPTALAFASDNSLYATVFGAGENGVKSRPEPKSGKLVKITGQL